jgi:hypothetical protein
MTEDSTFESKENIIPAEEREKVSEEDLGALKGIDLENPKYTDVSFERMELMGTEDDVFPAMSDWLFTDTLYRQKQVESGRPEDEVAIEPIPEEKIRNMLMSAYQTVREHSGDLWDKLPAKSKRDLFRASVTELEEMRESVVQEFDADASIPGVGPLNIDESELDAEPEREYRSDAEVPGAGAGARPVSESVETFERPKLSPEERLRTEVRAEYADHLAMMERELMGDPAKDEKMKAAVEKLGEEMLRKRRAANPGAPEEELFGFSNWLEKQLSTPATGSEKHVRQMTWPERRMAYLKYVEAEKEKESEGEAA